MAPEELVRSCGPERTWIAVDCRFSLANPEWGERAFCEASIPGARYAHLERDLSGPPGEGGRHPLPEREAFVRRVAAWGIGPDDVVVAFDDAGGSIAARLWWMLRWIGHESCAVLDGGLQAYVAAGGRLEPGRSLFSASGLHPDGPGTAAPTVDAAGVLEALAQGELVMDARARDRYAGTNEPIDPVAGHIAGAINAPWAENLGSDGRFRPAAELRARFEELLGGRAAQRAVLSCGSGVTACHDLLAMTHAGLPTPRLYVGSWSDWIRDPQRPTVPPRR
jgi:thiosulfate/3-mercaptopyruvate sulfurtransferase